jgi:hypothetical protein
MEMEMHGTKGLEKDGHMPASYILVYVYVVARASKLVATLVK